MRHAGWPLSRIHALRGTCTFPVRRRARRNERGIASYSDDSHRASFARGGTSCNEAMRTAGRAPQAVAGLTHRVKLGQTRNINTRTHFLMPCSGQLPFLGSSAVPIFFWLLHWRGPMANVADEIFYPLNKFDSSLFSRRTRAALKIRRGGKLHRLPACNHIAQMFGQPSQCR